MAIDVDVFTALRQFRQQVEDLRGAAENTVMFESFGSDCRVDFPVRLDDLTALG